MRCRVFSCALVVFVPAFAASPGPSQSAEPVLHVRIYNCAKLPSAELRFAEAEAERILRQAGIQPVWANCGATGDCGCAGDVSIRVVSRTRGAFGQTVLGFAQPANHGGVATLFYPHAVSIQSYNCFLYQILGRTMAHEIAHLLLGPYHSGVGVMRHDHGIEEWGSSGSAQWFFTPAESSRMRCDVARRMAERKSILTGSLKQ